MLSKLIRSLIRSTICRFPEGNAEAGSVVNEDSGNNEKDQFLYDLMVDFFRLVHASAEDNFDHRRFENDDYIDSSKFYVDRAALFLVGMLERGADYYNVYRLFTDDKSRFLYRRLILYRLLGHHHVVIDENRNMAYEDELFDKAKQFVVSESPLKVNGGIFGPLYHYEGIFDSDDNCIKLDCWTGNVVSIALKRQYYYSRDGIVVAPSRGDVVIDAGSCLGDTSVFFAASVGSAGHVYAFDPLPVHNDVLAFNAAQNGMQARITQVCAGLSNASYFAGSSCDNKASGPDSMISPGFSINAEVDNVSILSIDDYVEKNNIQNINFIKMDIEGYELQALIGARKTIAKFRPKLAISIYHKPFDLVDIPLWVSNNFPFYRLFIDHYTIHHEETVLYASLVV